MCLNVYPTKKIDTNDDDDDDDGQMKKVTAIKMQICMHYRMMLFLAIPT